MKWWSRVVCFSTSVLPVRWVELMLVTDSGWNYN